MFVNVFDAPRFAEESFRGHWLSQGLGGLYGFGRGITPPNSRLLAVHYSKPLHEVLTDMNKHSNNLIARSIFLTLAHQESGSHSIHNAEAAIRKQLVEAGLDDEALVLENGSGLSRRERLTARFLGNTLLRAYHASFRNAFIHTLPIAGTDGTLRGRFRQLGRSLRMKTGTLRDVRALAGYWLPPNGRKLAIVVLINSRQSDNYLPEMDSLVRRIVQDASILGATAPITPRRNEKPRVETARRKPRSTTEPGWALEPITSPARGWDHQPSMSLVPKGRSSAVNTTRCARDASIPRR